MPSRKTPPPGYCTASQAGEILGNRMLYQYVKKGLIKQYGNDVSKHKYYKISEVEAVRDAEQAFHVAEESKENMDVESQPQQISEEVSGRFAIASAEDMDALYTMAVKLFPQTASAARRRSWLAVEPRGYYIVKTSAGQVLAYFYMLSFKDAAILADYLHGDLPSRKIEPDHITPFVPGEPANYVALAGIGSDPDIKEDVRGAVVAVLLRGLRAALPLLASEGIIIPRLYAFSETTTGIAMCARLGMSQWEPPRGKWCTFQIDLHTTTTPFFSSYKQAMNTWLEEHGQAVSTLNIEVNVEE